jgi:hypothetical protein
MSISFLAVSFGAQTLFGSSFASNSVAFLRPLSNPVEYAHASAKLGPTNIGKQFMTKLERRCVDLDDDPPRAAAEVDGFATSIVRQAFASHPAFPLEAVQQGHE